MRRFFAYRGRLRKLRLTGAILLLVTGTASLFAQPDETYNYSPGRPGFTCGSTPLIRHTISAEASLSLAGGWDMPFNESAWLKNRYTFRYSPLDRLELGVGVGLESHFDNDEPAFTTLSPLSVMARINILRKTGGKPGLAMVGELGLPVGVGLPGSPVTPGVVPTATLVLDHNHKRWGFYYNIGAEWNTYEQEIRLIYSFMFSCNPDAKGRWNIYGEVVSGNLYLWDLNKYDVFSSRHFNWTGFDLRFGADYFITKNLKIDFSIAALMWSMELQGEIGFAYGIPLRKAQRPSDK